MEQELMDFDEWIKTVVVPETYYYVEFNESGVIQSLYSTETQEAAPNKIQVDQEFVSEIYDKGVSLAAYKFDRKLNKLVKLAKLETQGLTKIDDILHRIIDKKWSKFDDADISINHAGDFLNFTINERHRGIVWEGETQMTFLITAYNDPNDLKQMISIFIGDLLEGTVKIKLDTAEKFSVYTRRIFDRYLIETE